MSDIANIDEIHQVPLNNGTVNLFDNSSSSTIPSSAIKKSSHSSQLEFTQKHKKWFLWWNSEEWWACWIGFIFFGIVYGCVSHHIPQPEFLPWRVNPFSTFATPGNYGLLVLFPVIGLLVWLGLTCIQAKDWSKYPLGYIFVFAISLISKILASNGM
jgi:hypothetical protein